MESTDRAPKKNSAASSPVALSARMATSRTPASVIAWPARGTSGVGDLPHREVADRWRAAGGDQRIGIGEAGGVQIFPRRRLGDRLRGEAPAGQTPPQPAHRVDDLGPAAVIVGDVEHQGLVI